MRRVVPGRVLAFSISALLAAGCASTPSGPPSSTTTLTASNVSIPPGGSTTLTATVRASNSKAATGSVTFSAGTQTLGTVALNTGGMASLPVSQLAYGTYSVTANYGGNSGVTGSISPALAIYSQTTSTVALRTSSDSVQQGRAPTLEAQVTRVGQSGTPGGTVNFFSGATQLGTANVTNGMAYFPLPSPLTTLGIQAFTAKFAGDNLDTGSSSNSVNVAVTPGSDVLMHRVNLTRDGVQPAESVLTPAAVSGGGFGLLRIFALDSVPYAAPLYVGGFTMADGAAHNVVYTATSAGVVTAFDADGLNPASGYLWSESLVPSGERTVLATDVSCGDASALTIVGTPVIDRSRGVMYVVAVTRQINNGTPQGYSQRLHALSLKDGSEQLGGPTLITATVPGTGTGNVNGQITFDAQWANQRAALLEAEGSVWVTYASHCDRSDYHGWIFGYDPDNIARQTSIFIDTPNGEQGGIWMTGGGLSADSLGNIYAVSGNGTFDVDMGGNDYADSAMRLAVPFGAPSNSSLTVADYFTPSNQEYLTDDDQDLGTTDAVLFNDPGGAKPHLLVTADKTGRVYFLDRDNLGSYRTGVNGPDSLNGDLEDFYTGGSVYASFAYFQNELYAGANGEPLQAYALTPGSGSAGATLAQVPSTQTAGSFAATGSTGGTQPVISTNGTSGAVLWTMSISGSNGVLFALDPANLGTLLYSSANNPADALGQPIKFSLPVVADGHVFVTTQNQLNVFGMATKTQ